MRAFLFLLLLSAGIDAHTLTLFPTNSFGRPLANCRVTLANTVTNDPSASQNVTSAFHGLVADLAFDTYSIYLDCNQREAYAAITVRRADQFEVISTNDDPLRQENGGVTLAVQLTDPAASRQTWWIQWLPQFGQGEPHLSRFDSRRGVAETNGLSSGRYLVTVHSDRGFACTREVDLTQFTRHWSFQASTCEFQFDQDAALIEASDRNPLQPGRIEQHLLHEREEIAQRLKRTTKINRLSRGLTAPSRPKP